MSYEQRDNTGALFQHDRKGNEKAPSMKGDITIGGVKYKLAAWTKETKAGAKFFSLKAEEPQAQEAAAKPAKQTAPDFEDSIPFAWAFAIPLAGLLAAAMYVGPAVI